MARFASSAEYYRHHKRCFDLALEMGVTPKEAELELKRREIRARFEETHARYLAALRPMNGGSGAEDANDERWMMRD